MKSLLCPLKGQYIIQKWIINYIESLQKKGVPPLSQPPLQVTTSNELFINIDMSQVIDINNILPTRSQRRVGQMERSSRTRFLTNFYNVRLSNNVTTVYQYDAKFPEDIPGDSSQLFRRCIYQIRRELKEKLGYICHTGKVVFGSKNEEVISTFTCTVDGNSIQCQFKKTKELKILDLMQDPKTRPAVFQFFNSKLKSCLRGANICQLGKAGQFFQKDQLLRNLDPNMRRQYEQIASVGLNVLRGYKFTLMMVRNRLLLQLDVCSRVLQRNNLQEDFQEFPGSKQELIHYFKGQTVITRYGNYRTHKIEEIDFSLSPYSTFDCKGTSVTYAQYYKKAYNADICDMKQPLLKVQASRTKKFISKNQKINEEVQYIYLIPELVSLTGMKDQQRANHYTMQALAPFTKLTPDERFRQSSKIIRTLNEAKETLTIEKQQQMEGFVLPAPAIRFQEQAAVRNGAISNRGPLLEPHHFRNWLFVYSNSFMQDYNQACQIENSLREASKAYAIRYQEPTYVEVKADRRIQAGDFCRVIDQAYKEKDTAVELVFVILKPRETTFYGAIKDFLTNHLRVTCQCIQAKSLVKSKNVMSIASKVAIQMSCKAGAVPWIVENHIPYFKQKNFAYCSMASSKGKGGFTVSFAGTTNNSCSKVYSNYTLRVPKKEMINHGILQHWFLSWIKEYFMNNKALPEILIVYRESMGGSLFKMVLEHELQAFSKAIEDVKAKTKQPSYKPEILYLMVNKKVNSRFFAEDRGYLVNPHPGSVVIDELSVDDRFDFHLAAQKVNQGTCTPSQYVVGYDSSRMPQEDLIQFTYEQCYNYYNWQGSVKVPATLQCANKLSKLAGESILKKFEEPKGKGQAKINSSYFFL